MPSKAELLKDNAQVQNFIKLLKENKANEQFKTIVMLIDYVDTMEKRLDTAASKYKNMEKEIAALKDENSKSVFTKISDDVKLSVNETLEKLGKVKDAILDGIKNALTAVKNTGLSALNSVMKFFKVKDGLNDLRESVNKTILKAENAAEKIDKAFQNMHTAASNQRNVFRNLAGKETKEDIKPNGKIAAAVKAPNKAAAAIMKGVRKIIDKATNSLDKLEKKAEQNRENSAKAKKQKAAEKEKKQEIKSQNKVLNKVNDSKNLENSVKKVQKEKPSLLKKVEENKKIIEVKQVESKDKIIGKSTKKKSETEL